MDREICFESQALISIFLFENLRDFSITDFVGTREKIRVQA